MALIQLGSVISGIKGSIGGTTFSASRSGTVGKQRSVGKRLPNVYQSQALNESMATTVAWNALSNADKVAYNEYAVANVYTSRFGVTKQLTGYQWYKQLSQSSQYFTGSQLGSPPAYSIPAALPAMNIFYDGNQLVGSWAVAIDLDSVSVYFFATMPNRANARHQRGSYKQLDMRGIDYSSFFNLTPAWDEAMGLPFEYFAATSKFNIGILAYAVDNVSFNNGVAQSFIASNI